MEGVSATVYKGIKGYWRRKGYERLSGGNGRRRKTRAAELADGCPQRRRRRFWRIKVTPRLKLKLRFSPKKLLIGFRDAYVNMMMKIANAGMIGGGFGGGGGFGMRPVKEYDERMIVEIYKSMLMAQGKLVPCDAARISSGITCPPGNKFIYN
ncbi:hypothetical protein ACJIZ3_011605 [Penstemon smallii]|uniref:Uncharacterized protein n=1 Tax=Penstemon smallii TaxID=265156 RepID=A0ABD3UNW9_9LAMI